VVTFLTGRAAYVHIWTVNAITCHRVTAHASVARCCLLLTVMTVYSLSLQTAALQLNYIIVVFGLLLTYYSAKYEYTIQPSIWSD